MIEERRAGEESSEGRKSVQELAEQHDLGFVQKSVLGFRQTLREAANYKELGTTTYGFRPVLIFTVISAIGTFDTGIFTLAAPEIAREFGASFFELFRILTIFNFILIFGELAVGYLADHVRRAPLVALASVWSGVFSLLSGGAQSLWFLGFTRNVDRVGDAGIRTPRESMLADYYPPEYRGKAFAFLGVSTIAVREAGPLAIAYMVATFGWRPLYRVTGALMILLGALVFFTLKEPIRGYMERRAMGASEEVARKPEQAPSFGEAWRTIWSIRTLRRLFLTSIPIIAASRTFGLFFGALLLEEYGLGIVERGWISLGLGVLLLPFGFLAGGVVDVLFTRRPQRVLTFVGSMALVQAAFLLVLALKPPVWLGLLSYLFIAGTGVLSGPGVRVFYAQILPAHVRTLGLSVDVLAGIPAAILIFALSSYFEQWGISGGLLMAFPFVIVAAAMLFSAAGFFEHDMRSAMASQLASEEYRRAKEAGEGKLLVCRDVDVEYDGIQVLFGVDFDVNEGELIALLGTNGAGKSTLLKAISGTQEASGGAIVFDGRDITHMPPPEVARRGIVHMPGGRGIFPDLTVRENLSLATWTIEGKETEARIEQAYTTFPVLRDRQNASASALSGGEQQMLSLGQAFLSKPRLLMIDELALGLGPSVVQQLIEIVKQINAQGTTVILVEQSVNIALTVAKKAIFMEKGEIRFVGDTEELLRRPDILRAVYVKGTGALLGTTAGALKTEAEVRRYRVSGARNVLQVQGVTKSFGGVLAVDDVSLDLRELETLGLIGPNGAGKTTLFDLISGYLPPDRGRIFYDNVDVTETPSEIRAARGLVRRFQSARLVPSLTVYENILLALDQKIDVRNPALIAMQLPQARQAERRVRARAEALIDLLRLDNYRDKFVRELSTGLKRMCDLACVLAMEPKVLLLDEPSTGIAQAEAENLGPLLRQVRVETGCSMLVIEHDMTLISSIADELVAMDQGRVVTRGDAESVLNDDRVVESYLGTSEEAIAKTRSME